MNQKNPDKKLTRLYKQKDRRWKKVEDYNPSNGGNPERLNKRALKTDKKIEDRIKKTGSKQTYRRKD